VTAARIAPIDNDIATLHASLEPARAQLVARDDDIIATQIAVSGVAAPTGDERDRATWVEQRLHALSLNDVHIDGAGNVIGTRRGDVDEPAVAICAHLDTVFPRSAIGDARREGSRIFLPGIGDNGRGLAVLLAVAQAIDGVSVRTRRPVRFVATTGEEGHGDLRGARHFFAEHGDTSAAIVLDGSGDERIVHRAVGSRRFRVTFEGPGGHSWSDYGAVNPLHACGVAIAKLSSIAMPYDPRTTLSVTRADGGLSVNSIPQRAWFELDVRSVATEPLADIDVCVRGIVEAAVADANAARRTHTSRLSHRIERIGSRPCGELPAYAPLVEIARAATQLLGRTPELAAASTDANVPLSLGIPAIAIGGGGIGGDVHTTREWYDNAFGARGIARALTIVVAAAAW
jgi:acetylornithine deacetylase/succinyl-diaminopimelate desuccinylase-like protein